MTITETETAIETQNRTDRSGGTSHESWTELARFVGLDLAADVAANDADGIISAAAFTQLRAAGITSALVPAEFGGGGATYAEMGAILRELARHDPSTAVTLSMHSHLVAFQVWRHRHGMDAEAVFRKVVDGPAVLVSTGASDWMSSNGTAVKVDGGYRVSARKPNSSGCEIGNVLVTSFRWDDAPDGPQVLHCSIPFAAEGVSIDTTWDTLGLRATGSHTVVLDDVFVPDAAVSIARPADVWHPVWNAILGAAMPLIMSAYLGIADAAVDIAVGRADGSDRIARAPAARRDARFPHDRQRCRGGDVGIRGRPPVRQHRRPRQPHAGPQDGRGRGRDRHGPPGDRDHRRCRLRPQQ